MPRHILTLILILFFAGCSQRPQPEIISPTLNYPPKLGVTTRSDWGSLPLTKTLPEHSITKITIHHGGVDFPPEKDPVEHIRNLQAWSMSAEKNWIDIPYHFMIDLSGQIYETRPLQYPGATNTAYDPTEHALICVMGNYENQVLSPVQLEAVINLAAWLAREYNVSPEDIKGHKDYTETQCPGKNLYKYLQDDTIIEKVAEILD